MTIDTSGNFEELLPYCSKTELLLLIQETPELGHRLKESLPKEKLIAILLEEEDQEDADISKLEAKQLQMKKGLEIFRSRTKVQRMCHGCAPRFCPAARISHCWDINSKE